MDKKGYLAKGWCCASPGKSPFCGKYLKSEMYRDRSGYLWCQKHKMRGLLLDYASKRKYLAVECGNYAVGNGQDSECWEIAMMLGNEDMITAIASHLGLIGEFE